MAKGDIKQKGAAHTQSWQKAVAAYQTPHTWRSWWQVINTLVPFFILLVLMVLSLEVSYWLTLLLAVPAAGFFARTFIIFHDCGHGSFFKSKRANDNLGYITGILTMTPYHRWRHDHAVHHASVGDLDRRGVGDIMTLTVKEYQGKSTWGRLVYRVMRHPLALFTVGPLGLFLINNRFSTRASGKRERHSVYWTNLALLIIIILMSVTIGLKAFVLVMLPIMFIGTTAGVWLFYVQHQFEGVYWERHERWDYLAAALKGSSYYKLPRILQWFTGNIGFHHIHHVSPRIPNYYLEKCHRENPMFQEVRTLTLLSSLKCMFLSLWDEEERELVSFGDLRKA